MYFLYFASCLNANHRPLCLPRFDYCYCQAAFTRKKVIFNTLINTNILFSKVVLMLLAVLSVYIVSWMPFVISVLFAEFRTAQHQQVSLRSSNHCIIYNIFVYITVLFRNFHVLIWHNIYKRWTLNAIVRSLMPIRVHCMLNLENIHFLDDF